MAFYIAAIIIVFIFAYSNLVNTKQFINDTLPIFKKIMEKDYEFLLRVKYGEKDIDINELFSLRLRNGFLTIACGVFVFALMENLSVITVLVSIALGFVVYKSGYTNLKKHYKAQMHYLDLALPYYLKGLEILVQHYTVPIALSRSIETAPEIFKPGLRRLVARIDAGDSSIQPYIDFAKEYPVRDSMRMMRLLYRLSLGSQQEKHEQVMMFSKTVSTLQNKAREQKYQERLEHIE